MCQAVVQDWDDVIVGVIIIVMLHSVLQGYSMFHTLRKWGHLNYLSHWVALLTYIISLVL